MDDPLQRPAQRFQLVSATKVPNVRPVRSAPYRLAIIGEAPGADEAAYGLPFIGASGKFLNSLLAAAGVDREACFVGNVCKYQPPGNDIADWGFSHDLVLEGSRELRAELAEFKPHCCLLLGNTPLHFAAGLTGVSSWRGSILNTSFGKAIPSLHPAAVLREYSSWPLLRFDIGRARDEAATPDIVLPERTLDLTLTPDEICHRLDNWPAGQLLSFDIEGGLDAFPCCSVAAASNYGFIIAWSRYSNQDAGRIAVSLSRALYSESIPKCLQNSLYDRFVLAYGYHMLIRNVVEDTMLKQWEIYPELPKGLGTITSIWTRQPCYKTELMIYTKAEFKRQIEKGTYNAGAAHENKLKGCVLDSCVTLEACNAMDGSLTADAVRHYRFNMELLNPLLYMEMRGFNYDSATAKAELSGVQIEMNEAKARLRLHTPTVQWSKTELSNSIFGKKGSISAQRLARLLYEFKGYPIQRKGRGPTAPVSTDVDALLKICKKFPNDPLMSDILLHRRLESISETLEVSTDPDGRVRCGYNLVGTETGRLTCYTSPTGSGANLQTITKKLRKLYRADPGMFLFQCDLAGADGWTVAAHCLRHGDPTMWDDYNYGLKPARIIALMYMGIDVAKMTRAQLKVACAAVDDDGWVYFACKRVQHATNYGVTEKTGADQVMKDSYKLTGKALYIEPKEFGTLQRLYFVRYPGLYQWHQWAEREVFNGHNLLSASGHKRVFFGRRQSWSPKEKRMVVDHDTWKEFLADEPQENTTYATNVAMHRLWHDPENRYGPENGEPLRQNGNSDSSSIASSNEAVQHSLQRSGRLIIEPLHSVHDALIGQFPCELVSWAVLKIRSYFQNELEIANTKVIIPFDGAYGPSWGELGEKYGGGKI